MDTEEIHHGTGLVSPLDYRYGRSEAKQIFSEEARLRNLLLVEYAAASAEAEAGLVPMNVPLDIRNAILNGSVTLEEVKKNEARINHDVMAMVLVLSSRVENSGGFVHYGLTSNDVNDTATALQMKYFLGVFTDSILKLQQRLCRIVEKHSGDMMLGRTHGQHASPITFGLKMAVFLSEINRHLRRIEQGSSRFLAGKLMGPVGTGAFIGESALEVQKSAMKVLGLNYETNPTQLVGRDRYIEYISILNNISVTIERLATEIRNLQRPEIGEISEHFNIESQVGSSSMPSKKNPVDSETVCSLSRLMRSFLVPEYEASVYWHERDLTNSALERFTIPYTSIICDFIVSRIEAILGNLEVRTDRMLKNLLSDPLSMSESVVRLLTLKGLSRQDAHETVRKISMKAASTSSDFESLILETVREVKLDRAEVSDALNPRNFLGTAERICSETLKESEKLKEEMEAKAGEWKRRPV